MFIKKIAAAASLAVLAVATPTPQSSQCNTGALQCCQSVQSSTSSEVGALLGLLGVVLSGVAIPIGITCSPITVVGVSGTNCNADPVCCENNNFNGVIAVGCTPIDLDL